MRSTLETARLAVGNPQFTHVETIGGDQRSFFHQYAVRLSVQRFRGIPTEWVFAVLDCSRTYTDQQAQAEVVPEARRLIRAIPRLKPILLISDAANVQLGNEFLATERNVFCLDAHGIPDKQVTHHVAHLTPLAAAISRKLPAAADIGLMLAPYRREEPVFGWQFFGREQELRQLVDADESCIIVGGRRIGKTSLMLEVKRRLEEQGEVVHYINVQNLRTAGEVIAEIAGALSPSDRAAAVRRSKAMDESLLSTVLHRMHQVHGRVTLLLDELGNVLRHVSPDDWRFLGQVRNFVHQGQIRLIMSCFQEVFLGQQAQFGGPLINLAHILRVGAFSDTEVEEMILAPWEFWKPLQDRQKEALMEGVLKEVGSHPFFLQYFGWALFHQLRGKPNPDPVTAAKTIFRKDLPAFFESPVVEVFYRLPSPTLAYLFLRRGYEALVRRQELRTAVIDDDWVQSTLLDAGYQTTVQGRHDLLEALELHGLTTAEQANRGKQKIVVPIVYTFVDRMESPLPKYLAKLKGDIKNEISKWALRPVDNIPVGG